MLDNATDILPPKRGAVIQITDEDHHWFPALLTIDEVHDTFVTAYLLIPHRNDKRDVRQAYIRLDYDTFEVVGFATFITPDDE